MSEITLNIWIPPFSYAILTYQTSTKNISNTKVHVNYYKTYCQTSISKNHPKVKHGVFCQIKTDKPKNVHIDPNKLNKLFRTVFTWIELSEPKGCGVWQLLKVYLPYNILHAWHHKKASKLLLLALNPYKTGSKLKNNQKYEFRTLNYPHFHMLYSHIRLRPKFRKKRSSM